MRSRVIVALLLVCWISAVCGAEPRRKAPNAPTNSVAALSTPSGTNAPYKIPENRIIEFPIALSPAGYLAVLNSKNPPVDHANAAIAVPDGFDPDIPTPILLINATS